MGLKGIILFVAVFSAGNVLAQDGIKVGITHWGDMRSHLDPMQKSNPPSDCKESLGPCVGGIPQLLAHIQNTETTFHTGVAKKLRFATGNLVSGETGYLSVPDFGHRGTFPRYADNGWGTFGRFLNSIEHVTGQPTTPNYTTTDLYKPDFMSLGIKEFESGLSPLTGYLSAAKTTTVVSNMKGWTSEITNVIKNYTVHDLGNGYRIGVVGFVNPLANDLADASPITFLEPAEEIASLIKNNPELRSLKTIIAVGSGNYAIAKSIIDKSQNVKLVIYGGGTKDLTNNYPAKEGNGWIATAGLTNGVATKLGALTLGLNKDSELVNITGKLIELDTSIAQNEVARQALDQLKGYSSAGHEITEAVVTIDGGNCWKNECNLGNLVTDAMVHCAHNHNSTYGQGHDFISLWHGGAFFRDVVNATEKIKILDVHKWLPYHNQAYLVKMYGSALRGMFEKSAKALKDDPAWGQFLQVSSGVEVRYTDKKLQKVRTVHYNNGIPELQEIRDSNIYTVVIPSIIFRGKTVYTNFPADLEVITGTSKGIQLGYDDDCLINYMRTTRKITMGFEERIFIDADEESECNKKTGLTVFLTLFITALIIGSGYATWHFFIKPRRENNNFCF